MTDSSCPFEAVLTVWEYNDGPRAGVALYQGKPHVYRSLALDVDSAHDDDVFVLQPVEPETLSLVLEDWQIWLRWEAAHTAGRAPLSSHPALPEDRQRHEALQRLLQQRLVVLAHVHHARATFRGDLRGHNPLQVAWEPLTPCGPFNPAA